MAEFSTFNSVYQVQPKNRLTRVFFFFEKIISKRPAVTVYFLLEEEVPCSVGSWGKGIATIFFDGGYTAIPDIRYYKRSYAR